MSSRITDPIRTEPLGNPAARSASFSDAPRGATLELLEEWSPVRRALFRFAFAYLVLYNFPLPVSGVPGLLVLSQWNDRMWQHVAQWVGAHVLHLAKPMALGFNGSGDMAWNYVQLLCYVVVAAAAAIVWSLLAKRREYARLDDWLRIYLRVVLAMIMLGYGAIKVIKSQFPSASPVRLTEPLGEFSPMGLLWTFMGYSYAYNVFTGLGEMVGGVLLFFRRTALAGALLLIVVTGNVVMLNYAFDVPVKLFSTHLLLMAIYIALPDLKRLIDFLFLHRPTTPRSLASPLPPGWGNRGRVALKVLFVPMAVVYPLWQARDSSRKFGDAAPRPLMYGVYEVEVFARNGAVVPPLVTDTTRWRRVFFSRPGALTVRLMNDSIRGFALQRDDTARRLTIYNRADSTTRWTFAYARPDSSHVVLDGLLRGDTVHLELRRVDHTRFLLVSRGFHWINEVPFNR